MTKRIRYVALGAGLAYFFDPENGKSRRKATVKRVAVMTRRTREQQPRQDDAILARKVESELFRDAGVPKGKINVDAEQGKVVLRGEADSPEMIDALAGNARNVQGVQEVENLLHTPGQPAPARD